MGQLIKEISFMNFYNYSGDYEQNRYSFDKGLNIIVGDNGAGKSKFFNGIQWLLSDKVFDSDTKQYYSVSSNKFKLVSDKAKVECSKGEAIRTGVKLIYQNSTGDEFEIIKEIVSRKLHDGFATEESNWDINLSDVVVNKKEILKFKPVYDLDEKDRIIRNLIRKDLRKYALIQGEEVDQIVDLTDPENITQTIKTLTNIDKVESLIDLLKYMALRADRELNTAIKETNKNNNELNQKIRLKEELEEKLEDKKNDLEDFRKSLQKEEQQKEKYLSNYATAERRKTYRDKIDRLNYQLDKIKEDEQSFINNINSKLFASPHYWLINGTKPYVELYSKIRDNYQERRIEDEAERKADQKIASKLPVDSPDNTSLERMIKEEICFVCGRTALKGSDEWNHINEVFQSHKNVESSESNRKNNLHTLIDNLLTNNASLSNQINDIDESINNSFQKLDELQQSKKAFKNLIKNEEQSLLEYGTLDSDEKDRDVNLINEYTNTIERVGNLESRIKGIENDIEKLNNLIEKLDNEISLIDQGDINNNYVLNLKVAKDLLTSTEKTREKIIQQMISKLEDEANKHFQNLTKHNDISGGNLKFERHKSDLISLISVDSEGNKLWGLSEGFQRMRKLAVILAIITANQRYSFIYPFIADAPLSSFGKNFIVGFFEVFNSPNFVFDQSIILIKELYDSESDSKLSQFGTELIRGGNLSSLYLNEVDENLPQTQRITKITRLK